MRWTNDGWDGACMENWIKCQRNIPKLKIALGKMANNKTAPVEQANRQISHMHSECMLLMGKPGAFCSSSAHHSVKNGEKYRHRAIAIADLSGCMFSFRKKFTQVSLLLTH